MKSPKRPARSKDLLTPSDYETLASFRYGIRRYLTFAEANARSVGLTSQQHQALLAIKVHTARKPMSIGDLAAELLIKHHSTVELVGRLEKAGLTERSVDLEDRRKVLVALTPRGEKMLGDLSVGNLRQLRLVAPMFEGLAGQVEKLSSN
jgi:DNA-binding MarR family transcriptional regulator